mmetsp:Transcript_8857/g.15558  ORF Transcript_8857/g.15558 Transcript_8857/m.15558 type:complete len:246 (+) Transcript_8857:133-870(+)
MAFIFGAPSTAAFNTHKAAATQTCAHPARVARNSLIVRHSGVGEEELGFSIPEATREDMKRLLDAPSYQDMLKVVQEIRDRTGARSKPRITPTTDYFATFSKGGAPSNSPSDVPPPLDYESLFSREGGRVPPAAAAPVRPAAAAPSLYQPPQYMQPPPVQQQQQRQSPKSDIEAKIAQVEAMAKQLRESLSNQAANQYMDSLGGVSKVQMLAKELKHEYERHWQASQALNAQHEANMASIFHQFK